MRGPLLVVLAGLVAGAPSLPAQPVSNNHSLPAHDLGGPFTSQFFPPQPAGIPIDDVQGEIVNYETLLAKPIVVTEDGQVVLVANEPDGRLVVLDRDLANVIAEVPLGQGISAIAERPGVGGAEIWVTLRHQMGVVVVQRATWTVSHLLRYPISAQIVGARYADTPGGIVFDPTGAKAYVAASSTDHLVVFDAAAKSYLTAVPLQSSHNGALTLMNEPFAMARSGNLVFVASYRSGNQTIMDEPGMGAAIVDGPNNQVTVLPDALGRTLPDFDVMVVDTTTDAVVDVKTDIGTVLLGLGVHEPTQRLVIPNLESRNGEHIGERSFLDGQVAIDRLTFVDIVGNSTGPHTVQRLDNLTGAPSTPFVNVVQPSDIAVDRSGRVYTAGYGSSNIGVFDANGTFLGTLPTDVGPLGLWFSPDPTPNPTPNDDRLYCYNRASATITAYDVTGSSLPSGSSWQTTLFDPTYDNVVAGRKIFLDSSHSLQGTDSCASCHAHLRNDGVAWDLSKHYQDPVDGVGFTLQSPPRFWKDRKGVMQTQDLRSLEGVPPYHWRGEQTDLIDFNDAFQDLLHGEKLSAAEFALLEDYVFSAVYPANPFQPLNRTFSSQAQSGISKFLNADAHGFSGNPVSCGDCHDLPTGSDAGITDEMLVDLKTLLALPPASLLNTTMVIKSTQLRGMWTKFTDLADVDPLLDVVERRPVTGTGFFHSGVVDSMPEFVTRFFPGPNAPAETRFMFEFDSGIAPAANYSDLIDQSQPQKGVFLVDQATAGNCDLVAHGRIRVSGVWHTLGFVFDRTLNPPAFRPSDSTLGPFTLSMLQGMAQAFGAELLLLGVPLGSGERLGVDRDRDMVFDHDELALQTDPQNPDTDGDGLWDGYDLTPLDPLFNVSPAVAPAVSDPTVEWSTTNSVKITYRTDTFSPTRVLYGVQGQPLTRVAGDPLNLPAGSNRWKRVHTAFLRLLDENESYDFQVETMGQNGFSALTPVKAAVTQPDVFTQSLVVAEVELTPVQANPVTTWVARVKIEDGHGNAVDDVLVQGRWTMFLGNQPVYSALTYNLGPVPPVIAPLTGTPPFSPGTTFFQIDVPFQAPGAGNGMAFDIPMHLDQSDITGMPLVPGVIHNPSVFRLGSSFNWPESPQTSDKTILQ